MWLLRVWASEDEVLKETVVFDLLYITRWGAEWCGIPQAGGRIIPNQECSCSSLLDWAHCHQPWQKMQIFLFPYWKSVQLVVNNDQKRNSKFGISCSKIGSNHSSPLSSSLSTVAKKISDLKMIISVAPFLAHQRLKYFWGSPGTANLTQIYSIHHFKQPMRSHPLHCTVTIIN